MIAGKLKYILPMIVTCYGIANLAAEDARLMVQLPHELPPTFLTYTHDGKRIISISSDNSLKIWSLSGKILHDLTAHQDHVLNVAISDNDDHLLSLDRKGVALLWSREGKLLKTIKTDFNHEGGLAYLEKLNQFVTARYDGEISIWSMDGAKLKSFKGHSYGIKVAAANAQCNCFLTGTKDGDIGIWNADGTPKAKASVDGAVNSLHISADGKTFLAGGSGTYGLFKSKVKTAKLWDMAGNEIRKFASDAQIGAAAMTPDSNFVALAKLNGTVEIFEISASTSRVVTIKSSDQDKQMSLAVHPKAEQFAVGSWGEHFAIRDWAGIQVNDDRGNRYGAFHTTNPLFHASDYGNLSVVAEKERGEYFENVLKMTVNRQATIAIKVPEFITCLTARLTPGIVAVGTLSGPIKLFGTDGQLQSTLTGHGSPVHHVGIVGREGNLLASGGSFDGTVKLWNLETGRLWKSFQGHTGVIEYVAFDSDIQIMAVYAGYIWYLWDTQSGNLLGIYNGPGNPFTQKNPEKFAVVSMDGRFDYAGDAHTALHWAIGDETIPLEQFRDKYQAAGLLAEILSGKKFVKPATPKPEIAVSKRLVGKVFQIKPNGDVVIFTKVSGSLRAGKKLRILNGTRYVDATISNTLHTNVTARSKGSVAVGNPVFE